MPTPTFPEWSRRYTVLSFSKIYLNVLGYAYDDINRLSEEDMKRIAELLHRYALVGFERIVRLTVDCYLLNHTTAPLDERDVKRCDVCLTWVATRQVQVGKESYAVCDKPRCQDKGDALLQDRETRAGQDD